MLNQRQVTDQAGLAELAVSLTQLFLHLSVALCYVAKLLVHLFHLTQQRPLCLDAQEQKKRRQTNNLVV